MKTITIHGRTWKIKFKKSGGGEFSSNPATITLGADRDDEEIVQIFFHEIFEGILAMADFRYEAVGKDLDYMFVFDHKQLHAVVKDFYLAIRPMIRPGVLLSSKPRGKK